MPTNIPKISARFETTLASSFSSSATTFNLTSATDKAGNALSGIYGFVIDNGSSPEEFVIATVSGTTGTVVVRGLNPSDPATNVPALQQAHRKGASVKITDYPLLAYLREMLNGNTSYTLDNFLQMTSYSAPTLRAQLAPKGYVDDVVVGASGTASTSTYGTVKTTTSTNTVVSTNDSRVPTANQTAALAGTSGTGLSAANKAVDDADTTGTGPVVRSSGLTGYGNPFGDGSDGTVTFDGIATVLGLVPSANVYTLTRDIFLDIGTINGGVTINAGGYRIHAKTSLSNAGTIHRNGNAASGTTGGTAPAAGTILGGTAGSNGTAGAGGVLGAGGTSNGTAGTNGTSTTKSIGVAGSTGGAGGAGGGGSGGTGGTGGTITASTQGIRALPFAINFFESLNGTISAFSNSAGAGGGGSGGRQGDGASTITGGSGGGGGSSGGVVWIAAKTLTNTGTIAANGGAGANGTSGSTTSGGSFGGGGGGAGGSGGLVVLIYHTITLGTVTATGGTFGTGANGGTSGSAGVTGTIVQFAI